MLKKDMIAQVRTVMLGHSFTHEVLVYRDMDDYRANGPHHRAMNGDRQPIAEAMKDPRLLAPGRVWDVFTYHRAFGDDCAPVVREIVELVEK